MTFEKNKSKSIMFFIVSFIIFCAFVSNDSRAQEYDYLSGGYTTIDSHFSFEAACQDVRYNSTSPPITYENFTTGACIGPGGNGDFSCSCFVDQTWINYNTTGNIELLGAVLKRKLNPEEAKKTEGCTGENGRGNPCNVATGNKFQSETDFSSNGASFIRSYNSQNLWDSGLGKGWRSNYQKKLIVSVDSLFQVSATGRGEPWQKINGVWQGDSDSKVSITETSDGFSLTKANGASEKYNDSGQLMTQISSSGVQVSYQYDDNNLLSKVTHHYGREINFTYIYGYLTTVTDSLGNVYTYVYSNNNLVEVIYSDTTPNDSIDNPRRTYHYENAQYPNNLTGITDENGDRFATWSYDLYGKAISTEHAQTTSAVGQERIELNYLGSN